MEEEAVMVAEEPMATKFLSSTTGLWVFGAFILALPASDDNHPATQQQIKFKNRAARGGSA
jgi:hypothetical protein